MIWQPTPSIAELTWNPVRWDVDYTGGNDGRTAWRSPSTIRFTITPFDRVKHGLGAETRAKVDRVLAAVRR